ncbi:MAG: magnetochrome domain-containing protein [Magnetococcales bacterium]|nr:magnetochrome domain-containing protein [Magnetococcales bacterium]NGZ07087.1 magnetochrome domain-containing protein [Magnetococcales bacterium]
MKWKPDATLLVMVGFILIIGLMLFALLADPKTRGGTHSTVTVAPVIGMTGNPTLSPTTDNPSTVATTGNRVSSMMPAARMAPVPSTPVMTTPSAPFASAMPPTANAPMGTGDAGGLKPYLNPKARLSEGHWKGLEALPLSNELKQKLKLPMELEGLLIDEVTLNAAEAGLLAGDVLVAVNGRPVRSLEDLVTESRRVQMAKSASMLIYRKGKMQQFMLVARNNLGYAQVETAPMILPGEIMPHPYRGPCTQCHAIGTTGHIVPDPDGIILPPPPIRANAASPHKDRGPCHACHTIIR